MIQNRAARLVTKKGLFTSQRDLLKETNWLSINQMIFYHTILQMWRVRRTNKPVYLNTLFNPQYRNRTRTIALGNLRIPDSVTSLAKKSIRYRGPLFWNSLPNHLKTYTLHRGNMELQKAAEDLGEGKHRDIETLSYLHL